MNRSKLLVREYRHPVSRRIYQLSGKLIDWGEEEAHVEYILDITERKKRRGTAQKNQSRRWRERLTASPVACAFIRLKKTVFFSFSTTGLFMISQGIRKRIIRSVEQETGYLNVHPEDLDGLKQKIETLLQKSGVMQATHRLWNDREREYRWIRLDGTLRTAEDGRTLLYGVYTDISRQKAAGDRIDQHQ